MRSSWDDEEAQLGIQLELTVTSIPSNPNVLNRTFPGGTDPGGLLNLRVDEKVDIFLKNNKKKNKQKRLSFSWLARCLLMIARLACEGEQICQNLLQNFNLPLKV